MKIFGVEIQNDLKPLTDRLRGTFADEGEGGRGLGLSAAQIIGGTADRAFGMDTPEARAFFSASEGRPSDLTLVSKQEAFSRNTWVHKCVMKNAEMIAALPFRVRKGQTEQKNHPMLALLRRPNPYFSENDLWQMTLASLNLYGEAFWLLNRTSFDGLTRAPGAGVLSYPKSIWTVHPRQMDAVLSADRQILLAWRLSLPGVGQNDIDPADVLHFRFPNLFNPWRGTSPLDAASLAVTGDQAAQKHNLGVFARGAVPKGVLITPKNLNPQQADQVIAKFEARHAESARPAILHSGLDYRETQMTNLEMDFKGLREMNREDILASFGVPPVAVGLLAHASYANADMQMKLYWEGTLIPQGDLVCNTVRRSPLMAEDADDVTPEFDRSGVAILQEADEKKLEKAKKLFELGYPVNAINDRLQLGMPKMEWGDTGFLPYGLTPVDTLLNPPEEPEGETGGGEEEEGEPGEPGELDESDEEEEQGQIAAGFSWGRLRTNINGVLLKHAIEGQLADDAEDPVTPAAEVLLPAPKEVLPADPVGRIQHHVARAASVRAKKVSEKKLDRIDKVIEKSKKNLAVLAAAYMKEATEMGIEQMNELLGSGFSMLDDDVLEFIEQKVVLIVGIDDTTKEWVRKTVRDGIDNGMTVDEIADQIRDDYNFGPGRALRIARTEMSSCINGGRYLTMLNEGITEHEWLTSRGKNVRKSHQSEEGSVVKIGKPFPATKLLFPGQPDGPANEIINCRCITIPAEKEGSRRFAGQAQRDAYWQQLFGRSAKAAGLEKRFQKIISKHFHNQRRNILRILLN